MVMRFANEDEIKTWNVRILANPDGGNVLQGAEFAAVKQAAGWEPLYLTNDEVSVLVLQKSVPVLGKIWYVPGGPGVKDTVQLSQALLDVKDLAGNSGVFAVRVEPQLQQSDDTSAKLVQSGLVKTKDVQSSSTVLIDLQPSVDDILAGLHQKGRHALRRAEREGVVVRQVAATQQNCSIFYTMYHQTIGGRFAIRPLAYYQNFWQTYETAGLGQMFFAYAADASDQPVAAAFAVAFGGKSAYKDGASSRSHPVYGASHLLQWQVIRWAKARGSKTHDLCGTPPSHNTNTDHPLYGVGVFKRSFNKHVTDYVGAYDLVVRQRSYAIWGAFGEKIVRRLWLYVHHENYY